MIIAYPSNVIFLSGSGQELYDECLTGWLASPMAVLFCEKAMKFTIYLFISSAY
jgi:hypothetical protein